MTTPREFLLEKLPTPSDFLPFEQFIEAALYHPDFGYYSSTIKSVGRKGDFSTSTTIHPILGQAIATWALKTHTELFPKIELNIIELGAGSGQLANTILEEIPETNYHIVEPSKPLRQQQSRNINGRCQWHYTPTAALEACAGEALLISNELVDAFPCRRFEWDGQTWMEIGLQRDGETLQETLRLPVEPYADSSIFDQPDPQQGQRIEVHESYFKWLQSWNKHWEKGAKLTIDYGDLADLLYLRRPNGTIRAYRSQNRIEGSSIYHRMGDQDLTSDVNFTDLQNWSNKLGWEITSLETQRDFVMRLLPSCKEDSVTLPAVEFILNPDGAGKAFKVLEARKL